MNFIEQVGMRIKVIRMYASYSQKEIAEKLKVNPSLLSMYELGKREPSLSFIKKYSDFFEMSLAQFFYFDNYKDDTSEKEDVTVIADLDNIIDDLEKTKLSKIKRKRHE